GNGKTRVTYTVGGSGGYGLYGYGYGYGHAGSHTGGYGGAAGGSGAGGATPTTTTTTTAAAAAAQSVGHCLGVGALAIDVTGRTLYSGARDATVRAWALAIDFERLRDEQDALHPPPQTSASHQPHANYSYNNYYSPDNDVDLSEVRPPLATPPQRKFSATSDQIFVPPRSSSVYSKPIVHSYASFSERPSPAAASLSLSSSPPQSQSQSLLRSQLHSYSPSPSPPQSAKQNLQHLQSSTSPILRAASPRTSSLDFSRSQSPPATRAATASSFATSGTTTTAIPTNNANTFPKRSHRSVSFLPHSSASPSSSPSRPSLLHQQPPRWSSRIHSTTLARTFEAHSDWVNDVVLCNRNQSIVTASNDRMVLLWSTTQSNMYMRLGYHMDQVKCLAYSSAGGWVASGGLDRRVMIWDTMEGRDREIVGFSVSSSVFAHNDKNPKASIYSLACNPAGTTIASGSPDKVVRVWDPRSGKQAIGLTGHRDNIRALLVSDDGKWIISGSSDSTIKLWSLAQPQRCMVTYTHYEDSVWCLYSNHPDLDTFWAGGRDGLVTKMSRRRIGGGGAGTGGAGESKSRRIDDELVDCVAICKENGPVNKLVAVDDMFVWTATDKSDINRWRDIPFHHATVVSRRDMIPEDSETIYIPSASIIQQQRGVHTRDADEKTENDALSQTASLLSRTGGTGSVNDTSAKSIAGNSSVAAAAAAGVPMFTNSFVDLADDDDSSQEEVPVEPVWLKPDHVIRGTAGICKYAIMNNRMNVVTENTDGVVVMWDIVRCVKVKEFPRGVKFKEACEQANTFEWIAHWCTIDIKNGFLTVHLEESKFYEAEVYYENVDPNSPSEDQRGKWVLTYLLISYMHVTKQQVPQAAAMYHDHYLGAPTYTNIGAPPDSTSHYLFGQLAYYGPPDLVFDLQQLQPKQQDIIPDVHESNESKEAGVSDNQTNHSNSNNENSSPAEVASSDATKNEEVSVSNGNIPPVRLRPKALQGAAMANRPESVIQAETALSYPIPYAPNTDELPLIRIPPDVPILVSCEESTQAACYLDQFRSTVGQLGWMRESLRLDECIPRWVADVLTDKKLKDAPKMSFIMVAQPFSDLPDLPNNANRLSSNRMIRVRKLLAYVAEQAKISPPMALVRAALAAQRPSQEAEEAAVSALPETPERRNANLSWTVNSGSVEALGSLQTASYLMPPGLAAVGPPVGGPSTSSMNGAVGAATVSSDAASSKSGMSSMFARRKRSVTNGSISTDSKSQQLQGQDDATLVDIDIKDLVKPEEYLEMVCQDKVLDPKMTLGTVKNLIWKSGTGDLTLTYRRKRGVATLINKR
ncbi:hypothetical protein HK100_005669, partial [Physocladia obscura]